jgi:hypothetical protein
MNEDRYIRITLRIPRDLHARLQQAADGVSHSMNAEIIARIEASFRGPPKLEDVQAALYVLHDALAQTLPVFDPAAEKKAPEPPPQGE